MQAATPAGTSYDDLRALTVGVWFAIVVFFLGSLAWAVLMARGLDIRVALRVARHGMRSHSGVRGALLAAAAAITCAFVLLLAAAEPLPIRGVLVLITALMTVVGCQQGWRLLESASQSLIDETEAAERLADQARERLRAAKTGEEAIEWTLDEFARLLECESVVVMVERDGHYRQAGRRGAEPAAEVLFTASSLVVKHMAAGRSARAVLLGGRFDSSFGHWSRALPELAEAEQLRLDALGAKVLVPMKTGTALRGFVTLGRRNDGHPYNASHLRVASRIAQAAAAALDAVDRLGTVSAEAAQEARERTIQEVAALMRWSLLPCDQPEMAGADYHARCVAAPEPTGVFVDLLALPGEVLGIVMAQSSQRGLKAIIHLSRVQAWLRSKTWPFGDDLVGLAAAAERTLTAEGALGLFLALFDMRSRQLRYINAGFLAPVLLRRNAQGAEALRLPASGPELGAERAGPLEQGSVALLPGDLLMGFSQGVVQARNSAGERWGEGELIGTVLAWEGQRAADVQELVRRTIDDFTGSSELREDLALVLLRLNP